MFRTHNLVSMKNQRLPIWVQLLQWACGELAAVIAQLLSKCVENGWKWQRGVKEIAFPFPCCPVNCEDLARRKNILLPSDKKSWRSYCHTEIDKAKNFHFCCFFGTSNDFGKTMVLKTKRVTQSNLHSSTPYLKFIKIGWEEKFCRSSDPTGKGVCIGASRTAVHLHCVSVARRLYLVKNRTPTQKINTLKILYFFNYLCI